MGTVYASTLSKGTAAAAALQQFATLVVQSRGVVAGQAYLKQMYGLVPLTPAKLTYVGPVITNPGPMPPTSPSGGGGGGNPAPAPKFYEAEDTVKGPTKVSIIATGLRPYTLHDFYFNGTLSNSKVQSLSGPGTLRTFGVNTVGQSTVISDGSGKIDIEFYYDNGIPDTLNETEYTQLKAAESSLEGNKPLKLVSPDGLSKIEFVMPVDLNIGT